MCIPKITHINVNYVRTFRKKRVFNKSLEKNFLKYIFKVVENLNLF